MSTHKFPDDLAIISFARKHAHLKGIDANFKVEEISDGNINFVYRVTDTTDTTDASGNSVIVKQALPYIRIIGEDWPLSLDRIRIEAEALTIQKSHAEEYVPHLHHFDPSLYAIVMEDIGDHHSLRQELINRVPLPNLADQLADFLANTLFYTSNLALDIFQKNEQLGRFLNPDLCNSTAEVFFHDPYCDHERNNYNPLISDDVTEMWLNDELKAEVAELKYRFFNKTEALLHADLHSGSVFVTTTSCKVIDPEFSFCGPIGFDIGSFLGNLLLNFCAQHSLPTTENEGESERKAYQDFLLETIIKLWNGFAEKFSELMQKEVHDPSLKNNQWQQQLLKEIFADSLGYAGTEMIRRTVGIAHVDDLESISDNTDRAAAEKMAIHTGQTLILKRKTIGSIEELIEVIQL